jgi:TolB-like protein/tetratricopeptide (TPR) repeat protein/tRNA A-37 threonylcarbamoyl transferase component Bud32
MKTFSPGLSDSIASVVDDPRPCPHCDSSSHVAGGLCVGCLLEAGLVPADGCESAELSGLLAEVNLPDQNWRLGNYEILEEIGRGGMGVIYRARQRHSRRIVAVKRVLSYHSDSHETLARFRREAQAAASLDHPNILPIYEVSESEDGLPFFSMKFAPGGTLQQVGPALRNDLRQCVALIAKIARAVQYAHSRGILHRDLKPGNILLDGRGEPLVSDFGLAKWLDTTSELTRTLTIFGTPGYIAPEQASQSAAELRPTADVYSLGAILFDLLAGRPPFLGSHALSVIHQASEFPAPKLRTLSKLADRDLETICARCLERDPTARYRSAHDLAEDLERWLEGRPILARPVPFPVTAWRWAKRNPTLAMAAVVCATLGAIAVVGGLSRSRLAGVVRDHEIAVHSVVVTPFEDLDALSTASPDAVGLADVVTRGLRADRNLHVTLSTSRFPAGTIFWKPEDWRTLASATGAAKILTGTVRQRGPKRRIVFRVIDSASGSVVARKILEVDPDASGYGDAARLAATELSDAMANNVSRNPRREAPVSAADEYLRTGKDYYYRYNPADTKTALHYFTKAIIADPNNAEAEALLALCWARRFQQAPDEFTDENYSQGINAAAKAVELDPELALGYRAQAALFSRTDPAQSQEPALCALELEPEDVVPAGQIGFSWRMRGRPDLALRWLERSPTGGQRPGMNAAAVGDALVELGDDVAAEQAYNQRLEFWPDLPDGQVGLARLWMYQRTFGKARSAAEEALSRYRDHFYPRQVLAIIKLFEKNYPGAASDYAELVKADRNGGAGFYCCISNLSALGFLRLQAGDKEGQVLLTEAETMQRNAVSKALYNRELLYDLAATEAALGKREEAFDTLNRAVKAGWIDYRALSLDPRYDSIRSDDRFSTILTSLAARVADLRAGKQPGGPLAQNKER